MSYQVIARRWRPQNFDEVVYQDHISKTIRGAIESGRIPHSFIFAGPRGVGKTTSARILARALNCVKGPTPTPCGECENCIEIRDGRSFDVMEIDGASNNSVDDIRELRETVNFAPAKGKYKVYIIDEVHMLSTSAFNALLKTLEEPPDHVIFIFATTEIQKLPETILSRCQKFFFKKISVEAIATLCMTIAKKEGFDPEEKAIFAIARAAAGSMRDAQSLLEQVLSSGEKTISEKMVLEQLGIVTLDSFLSILKSVAAQSSGEILTECNRVSRAGVDPVRYAAGIAETIRAMRIAKTGISLRESADLSAEEESLIIQSSKLFFDNELSVFFWIAQKILSQMRFSQNEYACIEMGTSRHDCASADSIACVNNYEA